MYRQTTYTTQTDYPGSKKCLVSKGNNYPTNIRNISKYFHNDINAAGEILLPFVVYKANNTE